MHFDREIILHDVKRIWKICSLFLKAYVWCVVFVMFLYFTHQAQIQLPFISSWQEGVALSNNRTAIVDTFYFAVVVSIMTIWGIRFIFMPRRYYRMKNLVFFKHKRH